MHRGSLANAILLAFYVSPLTTMHRVVATRNSVSILPPLAVVATLNGALWFTYGVAISAPLQWAPNAFGIATGVA